MKYGQHEFERFQKSERFHVEQVGKLMNSFSTERRYIHQEDERLLAKMIANHPELSPEYAFPMF